MAEHNQQIYKEETATTELREMSAVKILLFLSLLKFVEVIWWVNSLTEISVVKTAKNELSPGGWLVEVTLQQVHFFQTHFMNAKEPCWC